MHGLPHPTSKITFSFPHHPHSLQKSPHIPSPITHPFQTKHLQIHVTTRKMRAVILALALLGSFSQVIAKCDKKSLDFILLEGDAVSSN
jgi:hypothetical protein